MEDTFRVKNEMAHSSGSGGALEEAQGQSDAFLNFQERLSHAAAVDRSLLLIGERGTGKELAARRVHFLSGRWQGPFVTLNCAALAPSLIESELFGYEKGAFTGATQRRTGRFEVADGGTLFLDEIGNIPIEAQEKILRVVEYGGFERVGSTGNVEVDVRIVGATNADLPAMAADGRFKPDLLDRLSFEVLYLPPLRFRDDDILLLARYFSGRMAYELGRDHIPEFSPAAELMLKDYSWPGNIRELKNVVERAVYAVDGDVVATIVIDPFDSPYRLPLKSADPDPQPSTAPAENGAAIACSSFKDSVRQLEVSLLRQALTDNKFHQKGAARSLGLSYDQFRGLIRKYGKDAVGLL